MFANGAINRLGKEAMEPRRRVPWLQGLTALDLTAGGALLCGKMLADLGAEVIVVEKPGGHQSRNRGPYYHDEPGQERSLFWFAYCAGKKSITLDIESSDGRALLLQLVRQADILLESYAPGYLSRIGLDFESLRWENPSLIMTSITPFGQFGPYRGFRSSDLVTTALSGFLYLCGDADRPPVRISFAQAMLHAGAYGAEATLTATLALPSTGLGQHVDVSAQQCLVWAMGDGQTLWHSVQKTTHRSGQFSFRAGSNVSMRTVWPCKDGHVLFWILGGAMGAGFMSRLAEWMKSAGESDALMERTDWANFDYASATQDFFTQVEQPIGRFFMTRSVDELVGEARRRDVLIGPVGTMKNLCESEQLQARHFWQSIYHPNLGSRVQYPAPFVRSSAGEEDCLPPPLVGQHTREVYVNRLGLSTSQLSLLRSNLVI